jgi:hypothetical protein
MADLDHYEIYYADKLWNLIPAIYRTLDTDVYNANGPLRELVNRIGAQAATVRRSIDRLWEDQSIESCDNWVISYIGNLLATNLVPSLDARGQRLDVYNTIYYRRRKGTVAILEEIASDITGWEARVVEFFRRLSRTRHNLDPAIAVGGDTPADNLTLELAQGLTGNWTHSSIGGWADLRNAYGASQAQGPNSIAVSPRPPSAFDEYFHTADFRAGVGRSGWYNIPKLGVFLWRLISFGVDQTTPVENGCCYTFDPTGRQIPLFAASSRPPYDVWISPQEWQLPTPISTPLLTAALADPKTIQLYAAIDPDGVTLLQNSLGIFTLPGSFYELVDASQISTFPIPPSSSPEIIVFPETGVFSVLDPQNGPTSVAYHYGFSAPMGAGPYDRRVLGQSPNPNPVPVLTVLGGGNGIAAIGSIPPTGTLSIDDSLTYTAVSNVFDIQQLTVTAENQTRPVIRLGPPGSGGSIEWIFNGAEGSSLVLEGLLVSGCDVVLSGKFETVTLTCCTFDPGTATSVQEKGNAAVQSAPALFAQSIDGRDLKPTCLWIEGEIAQLTIDRCILGPIRTRADGELESLTATNSIIQAIPTVEPSTQTQTFGPELPDLALSFITGTTTLSRCTVMGHAYVHELQASECILDDVFVVDNTQNGCVRFSAWSSGSVIPRQYESVQIPAASLLFTSRDYGQPGYAQLLENVDNAIISGAQGATISQGSTDGSEMGAFASQQNPVKERSLLIKYQEYMPLGLNPVLIHVT